MIEGFIKKILFIFLILISPLKIGNAQNLSVVRDDGSFRANIKTTIFKENVRYISINDFANLFNARTFFNIQNKKLIVYLGKKEIKVTAFNPFIAIDEKIYQLPVETEYKKQEIYVPMTYFLDLVSRTFPEQISYDKNNDILEIKGPLYGKVANIRDIIVEEKVNGTLITITTTRNFDESDLSLRARHQWLYLDFYGGKVDSSALYAELNSGVIARIVPSQISNELAQIGFRLRDEIAEKQIYLKSPREILVTIKTRKDLSTEINKTLEREKQKWFIDKIVIDPGHGGIDPGAVGPNKTYEKDVVLSIAKYLKRFLVEELNIEVLMTREDDRFIDLKERPAFANHSGAKLFISIHANSNPSRWVRGVSTYFLGPDKTDEAREVAWLENSVIRYESGNKYADLSHEQYILSAIAQNVYNAESQDLAAMVQQEIIRECGLQDRGVRQAGFYVLWGASMPNVLVETAYISNAQEERLLRQKSFQKKIAYGIFKSIKRFKEKYESEF